jgi:polysaccharidase protein
MATTYYIDAATGSDSNAGTSAATPLQSLAALSAINLAPGDTVLLARGATYDGQLTVKFSGTVANPITYGAYGDGAAPVITGSDVGIYGSKTQNIVVQDLTITGTPGNAIFAHGATNWTVANVTVENAGSAATSGAISFESSTNVLIRDSSISGVTGDGIWISGVKGITIQNTKIDTVQGHDSDNIQVGNSSNVSILGNHLDMSGQTDSAKGNLVVNHSDGVVIEDNVMTGGGYGASVNSNNVTIAYNEIFGQGGYTWTFGIGIGEKWSVQNYNIYDNYIHDVRFGVALTGSGTIPVTRTNIDVHDNTFDNIAGAAIKVDRPSSGEFSDNQISTNSPAEKLSSDVVTAGTFQFGDNPAFTSTALHAVADVVYAGKQTVTLSGDVLTNDTGDTGSSVVTEFGGKSVTGGVELTGRYGSIYLDHDGSFTYSVNQAAMSMVGKPVSDVFTYLIADGTQQSAATLTVDLAARHNYPPVAVNDGATVDAGGSATGNILANDIDKNGDVLYVRAVDATKIGVAPVTVAGEYGVLTIANDGSFSYQVDPSRLPASQAPLHDVFSYKISDSTLQDTGSLGITVDPHLLSIQSQAGFH